MPGRLHAIQQRTTIKHASVALILLKYRISLIAAFICCPSVFIDPSSRQYDTTNSYIHKDCMRQEEKGGRTKSNVAYVVII